MRLKTPREKRILHIKTAVRWTLYYLLIFFSFIVMTSGTWMKPLLLIPIPLFIAINNNQYASVFTGALCGFLIDIACGKLFGYNAVLLSFFCIVVSVLYELYLKEKFLNFLIISASVSFIQCWLDYKFYYQMWKYDDVERIFRRVSLKVWLYTGIASVFIYLIMKTINHFLMPRNHLTMEEAIVTRNQQ